MRSLIKVAGASVRGKSHIRDGRPCQDKYFVWRGKDKKSAGIALADGAGSSSYSQIGAEYSAKAVIPFVKHNFDVYYKNPFDAGIIISKFLVDGLSEVAKTYGLKLTDMACTMLFVVISRRKNIIRYLAGHIGDGTIFYEHNSKRVKVLSEPERGEYANTTIFLTSNKVKSKFRIYSGILKRPIAFMIMSDGVADTLYIKRTKEPNQVYCQQIFNWCNKYSQKKISKALQWNLESGVFREVSSDDCSCCLLKVT
jgi:hypothetical protein